MFRSGTSDRWEAPNSGPNLVESFLDQCKRTLLLIFVVVNRVILICLSIFIGVQKEPTVDGWD